MIEERICGTCRYHEHEDISDGWVCVNAMSENCTEWTEYRDTCGVWEKRKSEPRDHVRHKCSH